MPEYHHTISFFVVTNNISSSFQSSQIVGEGVAEAYYYGYCYAPEDPFYSQSCETENVRTWLFFFTHTVPLKSTCIYTLEKGKLHKVQKAAAGKTENWKYCAATTQVPILNFI
jgi:hypothetical protein